MDDLGQRERLIMGQAVSLHAAINVDVDSNASMPG